MTTRRSFFGRFAAAIGAVVVAPFAVKAIPKASIPTIVIGCDPGSVSSQELAYWVWKDFEKDIAKSVELWERNNEIVWHHHYGHYEIKRRP